MQKIVCSKRWVLHTGTGSWATGPRGRGSQGPARPPRPEFRVHNVVTGHLWNQRDRGSTCPHRQPRREPFPAGWVPVCLPGGLRSGRTAKCWPVPTSGTPDAKGPRRALSPLNLLTAAQPGCRGGPQVSALGAGADMSPSPGRRAAAGSRRRAAGRAGGSPGGGGQQQQRAPRYCRRQSQASACQSAAVSRRPPRHSRKRSKPCSRRVFTRASKLWCLVRASGEGRAAGAVWAGEGAHPPRDGHERHQGRRGPGASRGSGIGGPPVSPRPLPTTAHPPGQAGRLPWVLRRTPGTRWAARARHLPPGETPSRAWPPLRVPHHGAGRRAPAAAGRPPACVPPRPP